ncbi:tRNA-dihydrouridine(47) synthase [NAD(P)(+)] [Venturia nashicola]|uniref:tRNA-dihydrouridine(47) synthase [NAD(P)(+)] n=1 Tax=Venturia nashicola TaxID=86259 RepID=A0A4Z1PLV1_9PEZI|nr:tRNA-dihydrouridine(47) synthase [NAD(P)(+)] [Venturia nashicola]TLD38912.1 tRNA-dihydrouridine(47) synthase [NAD(P)(+)] [Venturia nashicola]
MSDSKLDQVVKGAPPPNTSLDTLAARAASHNTSSSDRGKVSPAVPDPTALLPSSPPQIYLNLLILEASLRQQYLTLRARRRQHTFVVILFSLWIAWFTYAQFLRPREDGAGVGGSVYWIVDTAEKVALIAGCVMAVLFWATGQWERGVRWPRRWLGITNRGLRTMNCKIVLLKRPWWKEFFSHLSFLMPISALASTPGSSYRHIEYTPSEKRLMLSHGRQKSASHDRIEFAEEDVAPAGDYIKIQLLPKHFTADFREDWETYRTQYWEQENKRRAELRKRDRARNRELAKQQGGWFWWTGWQGWAVVWGLRAPRRREETPPHHVHSLSHSTSLKDKYRRRPSIIKEREAGSHSRSSSRSSTITNPDMEDARERRWSTASTGSTGGGRKRSKLINNADLAAAGSITARPVRLTATARSATPTSAETLKTRTSNLSTSSTASDDGEIVIKQEPVD